MKRKIIASMLILGFMSLAMASNFQIVSTSYEQSLEENDDLKVEVNISNRNYTGVQEVNLLKDDSKVSAKNLKLRTNQSKIFTLSYNIESGDASDNANFKVSTRNDTENIDVDIATIEKKFNQGWNYFSLPIATQSRPDISTILEESEVEAVWRYEDGNWESYAPNAQENPFNSFKGGEGYIVNADNSFTIRPNVENTMNVENVESSNPISEELDQGWNLIGHYWSEGVGVSSTLDSIKDENKGKIYRPTSEGLRLEKMSFTSAFHPGNAYWLMVKEDSVYAKDKVSGDDYSVDWSDAQVYQIGEKVETKDYNATVNRVEGIVDREYPDVRKMRIQADFRNTNITVNESFEGITFVNDVFTESGDEIEEVNNMRDLRKGESSESGVNGVLPFEIAASKQPVYLRTKVISEQGLEGKFMYNISDYLRWEIPNMQKQAVEGTGLDNGRYLFADEGKLEFKRKVYSEHDRFHWERIDKQEFVDKTRGEVYVFNTSDLADELNISEDEYYDSEDLAREVKYRDEDGKDVSTLETAREICSTSLTKNGSFTCDIPDSLNTSKDYALYWEVERKEKPEAERDSGRLKLVNTKEWGETADFGNVTVNITSIKEVESYIQERRFEVRTEIENSDTEHKWVGFGLKTSREGSGIHGTSIDPGEKVSRTEYLSLENENPSSIFLQVKVEDPYYEGGRNRESIFYNLSSKIAAEYIPELEAKIGNRNEIGIVTKSGINELDLVKETDYDEEIKTTKKMDRLLNNSEATIYISKRNVYHYTAKTDYAHYSDENLEAYNKTYTYKCKSGYNESKSSFNCNLSRANLSAGYKYKVFWNISVEGDVSNTQGTSQFDLVKEYQLNETANTSEVTVRIDEMKSIIGYDERSEIQVTSFLKNKNITHPDGNTETRLLHYLLSSNGEKIPYDHYGIDGPDSVKKGENATRKADIRKPNQEVRYILSEIDRAGAGAQWMTPVFLFRIGSSFDENISDTYKPELNNFSLSPNTVNTTDTFNTTINATDNESGIYKANLKLSNIHDVEKEYTLTSFENGTTSKNFTAPDVETTFSADVQLFDKAGNTASFTDVGELRVK